jgi:hypothetical protein
MIVMGFVAVSVSNAIMIMEFGRSGCLSGVGA